MPEIIVEYNKPETLKIIKSLAKYLDFKISSDRNKKQSAIDDILIPGDKTLSIAELQDIFTGSNIDAKKLREEVWKRTK